MSKHERSPFIGDRRNLSKEGRAQIKALLGARPREFLIQAFGAWSVIVASIWIATDIDRWWATLMAMLVVATRLNVLGLLVHEQAHMLGLKGRYGDLIVNWIAGYPLGISVERYAAIHLAHHKSFFTEEDPDFVRKRGVDWTFPMRFAHILRLLLQDVSGFTIAMLWREKGVSQKTQFKRSHPAPRWARSTFYVICAAAVSWLGVWHIVLIYWVIPLVTLLPLIVRLGAITEHVYGERDASIIETTPLIRLRWWEKLLLPNLNFTLHAYHHFYPGISFSNLPKVHEIFRAEKLVDETQVFHGYWDYLRWLQKPRATSLGSAPRHVTSERHMVNL